MFLAQPHQALLRPEHTQFPSPERAERFILRQQLQTQLRFITNPFPQRHEFLPRTEGHSPPFIRRVHDQRVIFMRHLLLLIMLGVDRPRHLVHGVALLIGYFLQYMFVHNMLALGHGGRAFEGDEIHHFVVIGLFHPFLEEMAHFPIPTLEHHLAHFEPVPTHFEC